MAGVLGPSPASNSTGPKVSEVKSENKFAKSSSNVTQEEVESKVDDLRHKFDTLRIKKLKLSESELTGWNIEINVETQGVLIPAIIDTAAQVSVMSYEQATALGYTFPEDQKVVLQAVNQTNMDSYSWSDFTFRLGDKSYSTQVCVSPISDPLLLGLNFLLKYHCLVDCNKERLIVDGISLPVDVRKDTTIHDSIFKLKCKKKVVLQPESVHVVNVTSPTEHLTHKLLENQHLILAPHLDDQRLLLPHSVVGCGKSKITIRNISKVPVTIKKNKLLGTSNNR